MTPEADPLLEFASEENSAPPTPPVSPDPTDSHRMYPAVGDSSSTPPPTPPTPPRLPFMQRLLEWWRRMRIRYLLEKYSHEEYQRHTQRQIWRWTKKVPKQVWSHRISVSIRRRLRVRTRLARIKTGRFVRENRSMTSSLLVLIICYFALAIWYNRMASKTTNWMTSISLHYVWWGLGVIILVSLLVWLGRRYRTRPVSQEEAPPPSRQATQSVAARRGGIGLMGWLWRWTATIIFVVMAIHYVVRELAPPSTTVTAASIPSNQRRIVEVGVEGTQYIPIPGGWGIRLAPDRGDAKFRVEPLGGKPVDYPTEKFTLTGDSSSIRLRSLEAEPIRIQIWFVPL